MNVIYGIGNLYRGPRGPKVVTVGVFDGVHRGHRLILRRVVREATARRVMTAVVTFALHPSHIFNPSQKIPHLTSLEHKLAFVAQEGINLCYVIDFNKSFASISPESFIQDILIHQINMVSLYVGEDFVFGKEACGDKSLLKKVARRFHFGLHVLKHLKIKNRIVSSTLIRRLIMSGKLHLAENFLGRPVSLLGEIIPGEGRGKKLGFPTANIRPHHEALPPDGVYATEVLCEDRLFKSVTSIGTKPTFHKKLKTRSIEVFLIMGFGKNFYGKTMEVRFIQKIRNERKFSSPGVLVAQIKQDVLTAKAIFNK